MIGKPPAKRLEQKDTNRSPLMFFLLARAQDRRLMHIHFFPRHPTPACRIHKCGTDPQEHTRSVVGAVVM
jgi:hypothetical protein